MSNENTDRTQTQRERVRVLKQGKTSSVRTLETDSLLLLRQYDRAMRLAAAFRKRYAESGGSYPIDPDRLAPHMREALDELLRAWEIHGSLWNRAPTGTITRRIPAPTTPAIVLRLAGKTYNVMHGAASWREIARLIDVWHRHYVGQKILRSDHSGFLHIGLLYEFGQALGVGKLTPKDLAKRFSMSTTKIQSAIRRYQRTTKDRSVS